MATVNLLDHVLYGVADALRKAAPGRKVTRSYLEFTDRTQHLQLQGIWTLLSRGLREERGEVNMDLMLLGQVTVPEHESPLHVEVAELALIDELLCLIDRIRGVGLRLRGVRQSMQIEAPDGWVAADLEAGPFYLREAAPEIWFDSSESS